MHRTSSFSCTTQLFCIYSNITCMPLKRFYLLTCLLCLIFNPKIYLSFSHFSDPSTLLSAGSKLQNTGHLRLHKRGIHSCLVTSSSGTARDSTELHFDVQEQDCPFQDKDNQTKYSTCLKGIIRKSLLHSWRAKHLLHILKRGRRPEHSNNYYILQEC